MITYINIEASIPKKSFIILMNSKSIPLVNKSYMIDLTPSSSDFKLIEFSQWDL